MVKVAVISLSVEESKMKTFKALQMEGVIECGLK